MGRSGYDISGFYKGGSSSNPREKLTHQKPTSDSPTMPKDNKSSKKAGKAPAKPSPPPRSSPGPSSSASGSGSARVSQSFMSHFSSKNQPPPPPSPSAGGKAAKGKEKESHRFNPFARPSTSGPSNPPPAPAPRPQLPAPPPGAAPVQALSAVPRYLGGSIPARQAGMQYLAGLPSHKAVPPSPQQLRASEPPTSVPRNRWQFSSSRSSSSQP